MARTFRKVSVIMPAFNEGECVYENLLETVRVMEGIFPEFEIILMDDGSRDNTYIEAQRAAAVDPRIKPVTTPMNNGKGAAVRTAFSHVTGDVTVLLDADLELPPYQIRTLIETMEATNADVVVGAKYHPDSKIEYPLSRKILSYIYLAMIFVLFGLRCRDTITGLKLFRSSALRRVFPRILCKRLAFDVEILSNMHRMGYTIHEIPIVLTYKRERPWGRIGLRGLFNVGIDTLAVFYRLKILRYYDKVGEAMDYQAGLKYTDAPGVIPEKLREVEHVTAKVS